MKMIISIAMNPSIEKSSSVERVIAERKLYCGKPRYEPGGALLSLNIFFLCGFIFLLRLLNLSRSQG